MTEDNACRTCTWYRDYGDNALGQCRRFPPTADVTDSKHYAFPSVEADEWCGEHTPTTDPEEGR